MLVALAVVHRSSPLVAPTAILSRRRAGTPGGRSVTVATTSSALCSIDRLALLRGSSARTRPRPETPFGMRARLKPAGRRARFEIGDADAVVVAVEHAADRAVAPIRSALCLTALVSSSFRVSAIGIASASGRLQPTALAAVDPAVDRPAEGALHRAGDRLEHADDRRAARPSRPAGRRPARSPAPGRRPRRSPRRPRASARRSAAAGRRRPAGCS